MPGSTLNTDLREAKSKEMNLRSNISEGERERGFRINLTMGSNMGTAEAPNGFPTDMKAVELSLYAIIFLISAVGNSLVCIVTLRRKRMKTVTNFFILNLAIADLTFTCICIPFDVPVLLLGGLWPYGSLLCKVIFPLQTMLLFASVYTLTAVSLSRYWAINHPLRRQLSTKWAKWIIVGIWIASLIPVTPYVRVLETSSPRGKCDEKWPTKDAPRVYTVCLFVFQYLFPLSVIAGAYISIGWELRRRAQIENPGLQNLQAEETKKIVRMLKIVTLLFAVCVLPNNVFWLWLDFGDAEETYKGFKDLVVFGNLMTFANSAANPICYTILNGSYRKAFKDQLLKVFNRIVGRHHASWDIPKQRTATMNSII